MQIPGKLVVRTYAPARRWTILASALLLAAVALYLAFEMGHQQAGFDGIKAAQQRSALQSRIAAQDQTIHELRVQLAAAATSQISEGRERTELARTIGELQAGLGARAAGSGVLSRHRQSGRRQQTGVGARSSSSGC